MAPLTPTWTQPSHPSIQKVLFSNNADEYTSKSISLVDVPPFGVYAKLAFPPCTKAEQPTYATVQMGENEHLNLNSDLVYINHSCEPSVIFDMTSLLILAGPHGLKKNDELTFFYPSTEWEMAQGFTCFCGTDSCKGYISGAKTMSEEQLEGMWLNTHIRRLIAERDGENGMRATHAKSNGTSMKSENGTTKFLSTSPEHSAADPTLNALLSSLAQARKLVESTQKALDTYKSLHLYEYENGMLSSSQKRAVRENGVGSRELSGEMGGDTL